MITEERISTFINSFDTGNTPFLNQLEQHAIKTNVPVIRPQMQSFLKLLLAMKQPEQILEVGTAIGFSALLMSEYAPTGCKVTTIEKYEKRIPLARENFRKAGNPPKQGRPASPPDGMSGRCAPTACSLRRTQRAGISPPC